MLEQNWLYRDVVDHMKRSGMEVMMGKPRAIRDRKSEMISCWVCTAVIAVLFIAKNLLVGAETMGVFNMALIILFVVWMLISIFYTFQYRKWKKTNNM